VTIHYELILLFAAGLAPKDILRCFGNEFSRSSVYRFHRIYRDARKTVATLISHRNSGSPGRERKAKHLDHLKPKKAVSSKEKWEWTIGKDGTTRARKKAEK